MPAIPLDVMYHHMVHHGMTIDLIRLKRMCERRGTSLQRLLKDAGVSRNALYTLARKKSVLPRSISAVAEALDVPPSAFLRGTQTTVAEAQALMAEASAIAKRHRGVDQDNVRHTLLLLRKQPVERLRRALRRGRHIDIQC